MTDPLRLGIAGLGTVGAGVMHLLAVHATLLEARSGRPLRVAAVSARDRARDRGVDLGSVAWEDDPVRLARRPDVDVFVELIGGADGAAREATEAALASGKHVVTANKALLAHHGQALAETAEAGGSVIRFEAAVAGGIPVVKALTEGLAANRMTRVMGVLNGTCNYMLTRMESAGLTYAEVFEEARGLGFLEADPTLDVGGIDAAHKLALLAAIAFGTRPNLAGVQTEGIERVSAEDIRLAADMGYRIKLLGVARMTGRGLEQRMAPCLVPAESPLGRLEGGTNMVVLEGDAVGQVMLRGAGAGRGPTASAVVADIVEIARGTRMPTFGVPARDLANPVAANEPLPAAHYLRLTLLDRPGALAKVAAVLGDAGVSIDRMRQLGHADVHAPVLIVTHKTGRDAMDHAIAGLGDTGVVAGDPVAFRIEDV